MKIKKSNEKNKLTIIWILFFVSFIFLLIINNIYGPFLYSVITDQKDSYKIGKECYKNSYECSEKYFKEELNYIEKIENSDENYFVKKIIEEEQLWYMGNCPCPYDRDSRGGRCGGRSSYSKGGQISYCYKTDISGDLISFKQEDMNDDAYYFLNSRVQENVNIYKEKVTLVIILIVYILSFIYLRRKNL